MAEYEVLVDDNFHFMEENARYSLGIFSSEEAAKQRCIQIVEDYLRSVFKPGLSAQELFSSYVAFGEDAFIIKIGSTDKVEFSSWDYAKQLCTTLTQSSAAGQDPKTVSKAYTLGYLIKHPLSRPVVAKHLMPIIKPRALSELEHIDGTLWALMDNMGGGIPYQTLTALIDEVDLLPLPLETTDSVSHLSLS